ncbi:MAG TPA: hypothetical protein DIT64_15270 [Verrucomicrobiales bacterium]|nr:hypothetical protein [Verrucomicrobiales bacterium]
MKNTHHLPLPLCLLILVILHSSLGLLHSQVPQLVSYQGRVAIGTVNFEGTGQFRFALVNAAGTTVYWGNAADTTPADGIPDSAVSLAVTKGLYSVLLGDTSLTNMAAIPASVWTNADVRLRVWFNDGVNGNQLLTPDQRLAPYGYLPDGSISTVKIATGAVDSSLLAANAVTGPKIASNAVNSAKLASNLTLSGTTTGTFSGNLTGNASSATNATSFTGALAGDVTGLQSATIIAAATVTGKALTGFSSTTGTITASDTILSAINKLNGNVALKAPLASPTFTGTVSGTFSGNGAALTNLNGANLTAGSIGGSQLAAASVTAAKLGTDVGLWSVSGANVFRSAGNVGIGTSSPGRALQVDGTSPAISIGSEFNGRTSLLMAVTAISGGYSIIQSTSSAGGSYGALSLQPNGGDVGIGTETPTAKLDVNGGINFSGIISGDGSALTNLNGGNLAAGTVTAAKLGTDVGTWAASGGNAYRTTGNVGIGTATPGSLLSLGSSAANSKLLLYDDGTFFYGMGIQGQQFRLHTSNANDRFSFLNGPDGTENVTIRGNGKVGIGTASPDATLHVVSPSAGSGNNTAAFSAPNIGLNQSHIHYGTKGDWIIRSALSTGTVIIQDSGGNVGIGTPAPGAKLEVSNGTVGLQVLPGQLFGGSRTDSVTLDIPGSPSFLGVSDSLIVRGTLFLEQTSGGNALIAAGSPFVSGPDNGLTFAVSKAGSYSYPMTINADGAVIIGLTNTPRAKLTVYDYLPRTRYTNPIGYLASNWANYGYTDGASGAGGSGNNSIWAQQTVVAGDFVAYSDERIKKIQGRSDSAADLDKLRAIEITDFFYKDVIAKGSRPKKKVIAQQVERVFPQAVSQCTDVVPDIYQIAPLKDGWVSLASDLKVGDRVKLIADDKEEIQPVTEIRKGAFRTAFASTAEKVFVFGREVPDFRQVDYEAIAMLNVSATQELARRLEAKDAEIAALKKQLADQAITMKAQAANQAVRNEALEARLARLEQSAASNAVKVALKK